MDITMQTKIVLKNFLQSFFLSICVILLEFYNTDKQKLYVVYCSEYIEIFSGSYFTIDDKLSHQDAIRCNYCKTQSSLALCDICNIYSCKECEKNHFAVGFKEHRLVSLIPSGLNPKCSKHTMEVCDLYCEQCDIPSCIECISSGEHLGHKITIFRELQIPRKTLYREIYRN